MNMVLDTWATAMWRACWQGGLVVLVVWTICRLLPSMPARFQCWLWRLAIVKFVVVLLVPWFFNVPLLPAPPVPERATFVPVARTMHFYQESVERASVLPTPGPTPSLPSLPEVLFLAWVVGVGWSLARLLLAWRDAWRLRRGSSSSDDALLGEQLASQAKVFGVRRPELRAVSGNGSPMLVGIVRPAILFPSDTLERLSISERKMALGHELAHIRRGDLPWSVVASVARAVFFFHPLAWWNQERLGLVQEVAADELAIAQQKHDPASYGMFLVSVVGKFGPARRFPRMSVETVGAVETLARRLAAMKFAGQASGRVLIGTVLLSAVVFLLGVVPWRLVAAEPKQEATGEQPATAATITGDQTKREREAVQAIIGLGKDSIPPVRNGNSPPYLPAAPNSSCGNIDYDEKGIAFGVSLSGPKVTDAHLKLLKDLPRLKHLYLIDTHVTEDGLEELKRLPQLERLVLQGSLSSDSTLKHLRGLPQLRELELCKPGVTDSGLECLKGLTELRKLDLTGKTITDAGLKHLASLTHLRELTLMGTGVSLKGLEQLKGVSELQELYLDIALLEKVKIEDGERLRRALPKCQIFGLSAGPAPVKAAPATAIPATGLPTTKLEPAGAPVTVVPATHGVLPDGRTSEQAKAIAEIRKVGGKVITNDSQIFGESTRNERSKILAVSLNGVRGADAVLAELEFLSTLGGLDLTAAEVTDAGLEYLKGLSHLQGLCLDNTPVTDMGLTHLKNLTHLRSLSLESTKVTDAGLEALKAMAQLEGLDIADTHITDAGMKRLERLTKLTVLVLDGVQVTDAGLGPLKALTELERLYLRRTRVTAEGVKNLQQALPKCRIESSAGVSGPRTPKEIE